MNYLQHLAAGHEPSTFQPEGGWTEHAFEIDGERLFVASGRLWRLVLHLRTVAASLQDIGRQAWRRGTPVVTLLGPPGAGKSLLARAFHKWTGRTGECITVDAGGRQESLIRDDLFGHVRGAFTGANASKAGAVERAQSGTVVVEEFTDCRELQGPLLRVIASGDYSRIGEVGAKSAKDIVLVLSDNAANDQASLESLVNGGLLRADFFSRIAHHVFFVPPIWELDEAEREDIVRHHAREILGQFRLDEPSVAALTRAVSTCRLDQRRLRGLLEHVRALAPADGLAVVPSFLVPTPTSQTDLDVEAAVAVARAAQSSPHSLWRRAIQRNPEDGTTDEVRGAVAHAVVAEAARADSGFTARDAQRQVAALIGTEPERLTEVIRGGRATLKAFEAIIGEARR